MRVYNITSESIDTALMVAYLDCDDQFARFIRWYCIFLRKWKLKINCIKLLLEEIDKGYKTVKLDCTKSLINYIKYQSGFAVSFSTLLKANMLTQRRKVSSVYVVGEGGKIQCVMNELMKQKIRRNFIHKKKELKWSTSLLNSTSVNFNSMSEVFSVFCFLFNSSELFLFSYFKRAKWFVSIKINLW